MKKLFYLTLYSLFAMTLLTGCGKPDAVSPKQAPAQPGKSLTNFVEIPLVAPKASPKAAPAASTPSDNK